MLIKPDKKKAKDEVRPSWNPPTLAGVTDEIVSRFFDPKSSYTTSTPALQIPEPFQNVTIPNPSLYALPTEEDIAAVVKGYPPRGGGTGITYEELLEKFDNFHNGKLGVTEKVTDVAARKCDVVDNGDGNFVWLNWRRTLAFTLNHEK